MLRKRKNKRYNEESNDDHEEGTRTYNLKEKIRCERFEQLEDLQDLPGETITLKWIQRNGFEKPILVKAPSGLDLRVPPKGFLVKDVGKLVGHERMIDVMDVVTQKNIEMSMKDWCKYYESRNRDRLLNVISLEFSHTDLDDLVESPKIVKLLDWVDLIWPKFLKESQTESTNTIDKMKYPKVQKYCLMSVKGSYTDFHIDFGGTSVWYHILRGKKIFWMCPPTELNLQAFEEWTLSGFQQDIFFGDTVEKCFRVELCAGNTFFIPSGWIHAVYTLEDSLVFGGNFLHSFGIENQLKVARIEDATKVPIKFRYPFYTEMLWYVVQHYVYCLTGKSHLHNSAKNSTNSTPEKQATTLSIKHQEDVMTESEQDESDSKKKKKKETTTTTTNQPRKRGRPPKSASKKPPKKPPTDDESTEIDSDLEEKKPAKNTATCRMTKNSLLRLQYEIEDTVKTTTTTTGGTSSARVTKNEAPLIEKSEFKRSTGSKKIAAASPTRSIETKPNKIEVITPPTTDETRKFSLSDLVMPETAQINGWSLGQTSSNQGTWSNRDSESKEPLKIHITKYELIGLRHLIKHLGKLSGVRKNLPTLIRNSRALLDDCKKVIVEHENDDPELAATGIPIGPELLNPKKSDINQLIEQFFKPSEISANDGSANLILPNALMTKSDSTTLTHQQRLKYNNNQTAGIFDSNKSEDKKITPKADSTSAKMSPRREIKQQQQVTSPNKKFLTSLPPSLASTAAATTTPSSCSSDEPRPKSPPTRPLSNKQYTSKTKKDNNLILPGSFADLIAATSTAKEVFEVSSTDVTSTLFGLKPPTSPNKSSAQHKTRERQNSIDALTRSDSTQDTIAQTTNTASHPPTTAIAAKESAPRPNSPEPPKISPPKRFINPAYKPQNKEKLIFASAPYVSPISVSEQSKSTGLYPWQSPAPSYPPPTPSSSQHHTHHAPSHHQHHPQAKNSNDNFNSNNNFSAMSSNKQTTTTHESSNILVPQPSSRQEEEVKKVANIESSNTAAKPPITPVNPPTTEAKQQMSNSKALQAPNAKHDKVSKIEKQHPPATIPSTSQHVKQEATESRPTLEGASGQPTSEVKRPPKGPPKKSKEARLIVTSDAPLTAAVPVIKLNPAIQSASVIQSGPSVTAARQLPMALAAVANSVVASDKEKPKAKRAKKQKGETANQGAKDPPTATLNLSALAPGQPRPPVICGLIRPPVSSAGNSASNPQQYLITRPLLFNPGPTHPSARAQTLPRTSMPIFTTPVPASMGLPNMQPGTRIVWATRPGGLPIVSTANPTISNAPTAVSTAISSAPSAPKAKSNAQKSTTPAAPNTAAGHMDNAALLSLATTALSTAPLSTTPTLSHMGARIPNVSQALMVNPMAPGQQALFAGQQFFNPFLQRMPMVQFAPRPTHPGQVIPGALPRPGAGSMPRSTGQLFFAPLPNQPGQPRYLITQPGFLPQRPNAAHLFVGHLPTTSATHPAFPTAAVNPTKESVKVKKVKTR